MFQKSSENNWKEFWVTGVGTQGLLPRAHMDNHKGMVDRSNAKGRRCTNRALVNVVTKGHGGAILPMKGASLQELKKIGNGTERV